MVAVSDGLGGGFLLCNGVNSGLFTIEGVVPG